VLQAALGELRLLSPPLVDAAVAGALADAACAKRLAIGARLLAAEDLAAIGTEVAVAAAAAALATTSLGTTSNGSPTPRTMGKVAKILASA
jgi:hypothetical protein